jgi:hypothetical protein
MNNDQASPGYNNLSLGWMLFYLGLLDGSVEPVTHGRDVQPPSPRPSLPHLLSGLDDYLGLLDGGVKRVTHG